MLFSSPIFFAFFAVYFLFHLLIPSRYRVYLIICGSTIFYAWWKIEYVWLPYVLMAIAYGGVAWMERAADQPARKCRAITAVAVLFLPLVFFKYTNFLYGDVVGPLFGFDGKLIDLPLPLGVSFVTFTLTAYIVDIYRRRFPSGQSVSTILAYVLFFPHLIAGPILRPIELVPQLEYPRALRRTVVTAAIAIFTLGLVKKLVFADPFALLVDAVYGQVGAPTGPEALLALYGFSLQIYCDFSGYTDMAIGIALLLGIRLPNNFAQPYGATSIVDFWRRWHITLSYWLRDYLYIPLGGSRGGQARQARNILITMALGGLWHGANWTFVIWGLLHGIGVAAVHTMRRAFNVKTLTGIPRWFGVLLTFHFVTIAWAFFRAPTVGQALHMLAGPFVGGWSGVLDVAAAEAFPVVLLVVFFLLHGLDDHRRIKWATRNLRSEIVWPLIVLLWVLAIAVSQGSSAKFVYFDF